MAQPASENSNIQTGRIVYWRRSLITAPIMDNKTSFFLLVLL